MRRGLFGPNLQWPTRVNTIKNGLLQTKMIGCKQKRSDANKKPEPVTMETKKIGCKQKRSDGNKKPKPVTMETKKIGCKQKRICKLKRKWNNVEKARADTTLAIFRVNEAK